ncbi:hypothetical protein N7465_009696 [Penicillium sp. CMV-2018d]|nr:hypothetical protein N7465_009696 [Penicillium sp. CMV-2018d]
MVTTRGAAGGTRPKAQPLPAKPSKAEKAAKAARINTEKEEKKAAKDAAKRLKDAEKAAAKADKDASKAAAKAAAKAAKVANTKDSTKGTKRTIAGKTKAAKAPKAAKTAKTAKAPKAPKAPKATKATKVAKATKITKITKNAKTTKKTKATKGRARAPTVEASTDQSDEDEDEDEESEEDYDEPRSKRRKVETLSSPDISVQIGPPRVNRPVQQIGDWDYMRKTDIPEGVENEDNRPLPHIYIGGAAPHPRWVVTRTERLKVPSKLHASKSSSGITTNFGGLQWTFEEGDFKQWTGLEYPALFELAYLCLEHTLIDTKIREKIYESLAQGPLPEAVAVSYNWYPALPPMPLTRHFATGSSQQSSRRPSDSGFYFSNFDRPNMAVRPRNNRMTQAYLPFVPPIDSNQPSIVSNHPRLEEWPTASRSASPDPESERGSEESQSGGSRKSSVSEHASLEQNTERTYSELTTTKSFETEHNGKQDSEQDSERNSEESRSVDSRRSSVTRESHLELNPEGTYSEPTTPVPLGHDGKIAPNVSEDGSIFGDADDDQLEPNSARGSREQSPSSSVFSGSGSDSEVSASSKISGPSKFNAADDNSAQSTNSLSPVSHDGLFSPGQIESYYRKKQKNFENLGGVEHHEGSERKRQAQLSPTPPREALDTLEDAQKDLEMGELETGGFAESSKRMRMESPSTPATRRKTAAEIMMNKIMSFARAGKEKRDEMRAAAAEKISDKPPVALLKKTTTGNQAGAKSQDAPSPEIPPNLQDEFLEQAKAYLKDPIQRVKHFPDPPAVRRARVWAGEELVDHEIKPTVDATLPPWAERHRPFSQWQNVVSVSSIELFENHADHIRLDWDNFCACGTHEGLEIEKTEQGTR